MDTTAKRDATLSEADVMLRRFAAWGGVCGAVVVPGAMLVLCHIVLVDGAIGALPLALIAGAVSIGVTLMLLARRAARPMAAVRTVPERFPLRLVGDSDENDPHTSRRSAA
jgi:hypothetical protein